MSMGRDEIIEAARRVIERESASVAALVDQLEDGFVNAAQRLAACEGHVLVAGSGTSHAVAQRLAHLLTCCGTPALYIHPGDAQHGAAGAVTRRDILIAISKGGETKEVNFLAQYAREHGAAVIAFTEQPASRLGQLADEIVMIRAADGVDPFGYIALGSSLTTAAMGDALCVVLLGLRGQTLAAFAATHPGGAVGRALTAKDGAA